MSFETALWLGFECLKAFEPGDGCSFIELKLSTLVGSVGCGTRLMVVLTGLGPLETDCGNQCLSALSIGALLERVTLS